MGEKPSEMFGVLPRVQMSRREWSNMAIICIDGRWVLPTLIHIIYQYWGGNPVADVSTLVGGQSKIVAQGDDYNIL